MSNKWKGRIAVLLCCLCAALLFLTGAYCFLQLQGTRLLYANSVMGRFYQFFYIWWILAVLLFLIGMWKRRKYQKMNALEEIPVGVEASKAEPIGQKVLVEKTEAAKRESFEGEKEAVQKKTAESEEGAVQKETVKSEEGAVQKETAESKEEVVLKEAAEREKETVKIEPVYEAAVPDAILEEKDETPVICPNCHSKLKAGAIFCKNCGTRIKE